MNDALLIVLQRIVVSGKEFHFVTVGLTVIRSQSDAYVIEEVGKAKKAAKVVLTEPDDASRTVCRVMRCLACEMPEHP